MKKALITLIITGAFFHAYTQVIVSNDKMNIVYAGVDNPISFSANGYDSKKLMIVADCGEITKNENYFTWKICHAPRQRKVVFSCFLKTQANKKLLGKSEFRLRRVPDPLIYLASGEQGQLKFFNQFTKPRATLDNFDFDLNFRIKQFDLEFYKANGDTIKLENHSWQWEYTSETIAQIENLKEGEKFCFKNFVVYNECEGIDRKLKDCLTYTFTSTKPIPKW